MKSPGYVLLLVAAVALAAGLFVTVYPYWIFLSRGDLGVPRGVYRCDVRREIDRSIRQCGIGADGAILREERRVDGSIQREWYALGRIVCSRELITPDGSRRRLTEDICYRISQEVGLEDAGPSERED